MKKHLILIALLAAATALAGDAAEETADLLSQMERSAECRTKAQGVTEGESLTNGHCTVIRYRGFMLSLLGRYVIEPGTPLITWVDPQDRHLYLKTARLEKVRIIRIVPVGR